ncbi:MAG: endonuclease domain-containing protein [Clostridiales bacterium]|nr:endonuclease domain-containing protein [Clostridiales bacterium]
MAEGLRAVSRMLRKRMTKEEKHIWYDCLRKLPYIFKRQEPIGKYIVDFFCAEAKLAIEFDGSQHYTESGRARDEERDRYLKDRGLEVIHYSDYDVNTNFEGVCLDIERSLERLKAKAE